MAHGSFLELSLLKEDSKREINLYESLLSSCSGLLFRQILPGLDPLLSSLKGIAARRGKTMSQVCNLTSNNHTINLKSSKASIIHSRNFTTFSLYGLNCASQHQLHRRQIY